MADWFPDPSGAASLIEQLAARMAGMYADAEDRLIKAIMVDLKAGMVREGSVETRMQLSALRARAQEIVRGLEAAMPELAADIVHRASTDGAQSIVDLLESVGRPSMVAMPGFLGGGNAAMLALVDMVTSLDQVHMRILRFPDDVYRAAVGKHVTNTLLGLETNRAMEQKVWRDLLNQGVTGFVDKAGRRWQLSTYVEMATRTATHRAFQDSRTNSMTNFGLDLVSIVIGRAACKRCARWAGKVLCINGRPGVQRVQHAIQDNVFVTVNVAATLEQARSEGLFHPNCFPGYVPVESPTGIASVDSRWFEGDLIVIHTASGGELSVTPNHPVLTDGGWVKAGELQKGHNLVSYNGVVQDETVGGPDHESGEAPIGQVFETLRKSGGVTSARMPVSPEDFHGDGIANTEVNIVFADRLLGNDGKAKRLQVTPEGEFLSGGARLPSLFAERATFQVCQGTGHARDCGVGGACLCSPFSIGQGLPLELPGLADRPGESTTAKELGNRVTTDTDFPADLRLGLSGAVHGNDLVFTPNGSGLLGAGDAGGFEPAVQHLPGDTVSAGEFLDGLTGQVSVDQIVSVERRDFAGHVYNLQTGGGWYLASNYIVHNCGCQAVAYFPGLDMPGNFTTYNEEANQAQADQREAEREIRKQKRELATAFTPADEFTARRNIRAEQGKIRTLVDETPGIARRRYREQLSMAYRRATP